MPGESYSRRLRSLLLYLFYVFRALMNSFVRWFCTSALGLVLFQTSFGRQCGVQWCDVFCANTFVTQKKKKKKGLWRTWYFCHAFRLYLWRHWLERLGIQWQRSWLSTIFFTNGTKSGVENSWMSVYYSIPIGRSPCLLSLSVSL